MTTLTTNKPIQKYKLNRVGTFYMSANSYNQCKEQYHTDFRYRIIIECSNRLDSNGFVIDQLLIHNTIIESVNNLSIGKSCEELCLFITNILIDLSNNMKCELFKIYVMVQPEYIDDDNHAYMELETSFEKTIVNY